MAENVLDEVEEEPVILRRNLSKQPSTEARYQSPNRRLKMCNCREYTLYTHSITFKALVVNKGFENTWTLLKT